MKVIFRSVKYGICFADQAKEFQVIQKCSICVMILHKVTRNIFIYSYSSKFLNFLVFFENPNIIWQNLKCKAREKRANFCKSCMK